MSWNQHQDKLLEHIFLFINTLFPWSCAKLDAAPHVLLSLRDIWRAHLSQKTRTAGCLQHTGARRPPEVSNRCWKADQKVQFSGGSVCQGHRGEEQQMFLMLLWDLPVLLSLLHCRIMTLLEWQESTAAWCPIVCALDNQHSLTFPSKISWSPRSDHPFLQLFSARGADTARIVWKVLVIPQPVGVLKVFSACPELWVQTLHVDSCMIMDEF